MYVCKYGSMVSKYVSMYVSKLVRMGSKEVS